MFWRLGYSLSWRRALIPPKIGGRHPRAWARARAVPWGGATRNVVTPLVGVRGGAALEGVS